ncbi:hypothetical protein RIF29_08974 [Crotalaria pallida]|uniref:Uncharacterized protein n=1 Tax=Crotalaria pallida TaxID=3830 RepID=A0AAN9IKG8_CROPI
MTGDKLSISSRSSSSTSATSSLLRVPSSSSVSLEAFFAEDEGVFGGLPLLFAMNGKARPRRNREGEEREERKVNPSQTLGENECLHD